MAQVISYDPAKLPSPVATPSKYEQELLVQYVNLAQKGKAAGDGIAYESKKDAVSAANSIKRAIRKHVNGDLSLVMRVWQVTEGEPEAQGFFFAISENTRELTGAAAAARANRGS
jgi:hypothetical protein